MGQRRQVAIPRDMLETLKLQEGDFVAFSKQANGVLIKPKRVVDPKSKTWEQNLVTEQNLGSKTW